MVVQNARAIAHTRAGTSGVNVAGYLRTESGVGTAVRRYVRALESGDVPHSLIDLSGLQGNRSQDVSLTISDQGFSHKINLVCADIELHYAVIAHTGEAFFHDRYNVAIWAWELPRFPDKWRDRMTFYDEIWVGTSFIANMLAPIAPVPVVRIPPVLTVARPGDRDAGRQRQGIGPDETLYLFMFDFHSHLARKNPLAVIDAFKLAFSPSDPAHLVLKSVNGASDPAGLAAVRERAQGARVSILDGYWPAAEVSDLMAACDAYISLHRAEGTGLTITDAMALGKPVIATGWSGNMDMMTVSNSFPVQYRLVEIEHGVGPYAAGETWAEPSVEHAAALMRQVFEQPDLARSRGEEARRTIEAGFSEEAIADLIQQRLTAIATRRDMAGYRHDAWARYRAYRRLGDQIRVSVRETLPPDATVLVVSKGDRDLVDLADRTGWHFPRGEGGVYAGYYPADSEEAIAHLEALRHAGAEFLLFPNSAFWWLEHYAGFARHLEEHTTPILRNDACVIYALPEPARRVMPPEGTKR